MQCFVGHNPMCVTSLQSPMCSLDTTGLTIHGTLRRLRLMSPTEDKMNCQVTEGLNVTVFLIKFKKDKQKNAA